MNDSPILWTKEQCIEAYDEMMIKIALSSYAELDGQKSLEENERLKKMPEYAVTPEVEKKIRRTVDSALRRKSFKKVMGGMYRITSHVAVVFLAVSILFSSTMIASAEFRKAVYKMVFTREQEYTLIQFDSRTDMEFVNSEVYDWEHAFAPTVMPSGYTVSEVNREITLYTVTYLNADGGDIIFTQRYTKGSGRIKVDTENAQLVQNVFVNDSEGLLVSKNGLNLLVWRVGGSMLRLNSTESADTLLTIAKGIKLKN